jgi:hypothetical protein
LRPFLNNRTHFIATTYLPQRTDLIPWAPGGPGDGQPEDASGGAFDG